MIKHVHSSIFSAQANHPHQSDLSACNDAEATPISGGIGHVTKDDANYPHACLCGKSGCGLSAFCPFYHFGQAGWTR